MLVNHAVAQLGHVGTHMVENHYGHLTPSAMAEAIRTLALRLGIAGAGNVVALKVESGA